LSPTVWNLSLMKWTVVRQSGPKSKRREPKSDKRTTVPRVLDRSPSRWTDVRRRGPKSKRREPKSDKRTTVPRIRTEVHQCGLESEEWTEVQRRGPSPISGRRFRGLGPVSEEWTEGPMNRTITGARTYVRSSEYYPKILDQGTRRFLSVTEVSEHDLKRYSGFGQLRSPKGTRTVD
jgi:hypothetical protein